MYQDNRKVLVVARLQTYLVLFNCLFEPNQKWTWLQNTIPQFWALTSVSFMTSKHRHRNYEGSGAQVVIVILLGNIKNKKLDRTVSQCKSLDLTSKIKHIVLFSWVSISFPLLLILNEWGFRNTVLLLCQTNDGTNRFWLYIRLFFLLF